MPEMIRDYDSITLDVSSFDSDTRLKVFAHYPGQVIRSFATRTFPVNTFPDSGVTFKVSQVTLLRKRSVPDEPCDENIRDHDIFLLESISNEMGCLPPYWRNILGKSSIMRECSSPEQFNRLHDLTKHHKKIWESRDIPCLDMFNSAMPFIGVQNDWESCKKCVHFEMVYEDQYYEEIKECLKYLDK